MTFKFFLRTCKHSFYFFGLVTLMVLFSFSSAAWGHEEKSLSVVIVGDTGIGERSAKNSFKQIQKEMQNQNADIILHLGDFVYQPDKFPDHCPDNYIDTIRKTLVDPYSIRIFVAGDNDLPPHKWKPKASGCWEKIAPMATPFDSNNAKQNGPGKLEGAIEIGPALFVVLNNYDWKNPTPWVQPLIEKARQQEKWVIFALHEPPITTAWYRKHNQHIFEDINNLKPDLVLSGNQHSYERFFPVKKLNDTFTVLEKSSYPQGSGVTYMVSGGGGAFFKPFADMQGVKKRIAPEEIKSSLALRSLMFHFVSLKIDEHKLMGKTYRICLTVDDESANPRWRPDDPMWEEVQLECDGKPSGTTVFDNFEIIKNGS